jgi:hypothetical protein
MKKSRAACDRTLGEVTDTIDFREGLSTALVERRCKHEMKMAAEAADVGANNALALRLASKAINGGGLERI